MGCHRCGTTLVRLILDSHPDIQCFDEDKSYKMLQSEDYPNDKQILGFKIPNWTDIMLYGSANKHYNNDQILFMMRDVRGFVASAVSLGSESDNWMKTAVGYMREKWPNNPARSIFFERYADELKRIESQDHADYRMAALFWKYKISCYFEMVNRGWRVLPLHYENLVTFPRSSLKTLAEFLHIEWNESLLKHHDGASGHTIGDTLLSRAIDTSSILKFETVLEEDKIKAIMEVAGELNEVISPLSFVENYEKSLVR